MRVAIVSEWPVTCGGSERVVEQVLECFPEEGVFRWMDFMKDRAFLKGKKAKTSLVQKLSFAKQNYRKPTGVFFGEQTVESVQAAVRRSEAVAYKFLPARCRANGERFSEAAFRRGFPAVVLKAMESQRNSRVWRKFHASIRPPVRVIEAENEPAEFVATSLRS